MGDTSTITRVKTKIKIDFVNERQYAVIFHNDDFTPMEYVVLVLISFFGKDIKTADEIMLSVHEKGSGVAGIYDEETAYKKIELVDKLNKETNRNLILTVEEI